MKQLADMIDKLTEWKPPEGIHLFLLIDHGVEREIRVVVKACCAEEFADFSIDKPLPKNIITRLNKMALRVRDENERRHAEAKATMDGVSSALTKALKDQFGDNVFVVSRDQVPEEIRKVFEGNAKPPAEPSDN